MRRELVCTGPATPPQLEVRTREAPRPQAGQALVRVQAEGGIMRRIASMADALAVERVQPLLPNSTYEMIRAAAAVHAKVPASPKGT